jgi:membrane fusion protein (multidrug efflux system)
MGHPFTRGRIWLSALGLSLTLSACGPKAPPPAPPPVAVQVAKAIRETVPQTADYVGQTQAVQQVDLVARVEGVLERVFFKDGSFVREGAPLMQIQQDQYQAQVLSAQGALAKAKADLVRAKSNVQDQTAQAKLDQAEAAYEYQKVQLARMGPLAKKQAVSQMDFDQTKTQYDIAVADVVAAKANLADVELNQSTGILTAQGGVEQAQAQLTQAELNLSYTNITSPVTGIISFLNVDEGNLVGPGKTEKLATVSTIDPIKIIFQLSETDYLKIASELVRLRDSGRRPEVTFTLADGSEYPYKGRATAINRAVDQSTGTISVETRFPNPDGILRPGQYGRVTFAIGREPNALVIPRTALQSLQGLPIVYVVGPDNKAQLHTVETGSSFGNDIVIKSGINAGDTVVLNPGTRVSAGTLVKPSPAGKD